MPKYIKKIGLITAINSAAIQDFRHTLRENKFGGQLYIMGCKVQGTQCVSSIVRAIKRLDGMNLDVLCIIRGGGSESDLFGYNSDKIIKAIVKAKTCIVCAIGHQCDFLLAELASVRGITPTAAAEIVCQHIKYDLSTYDIFSNNLKMDYENKK